ncbi:peptidoglycan-binding protein [Embleya sp. NPDC008237]|uniref:peptidoglycan-binding protein n=1 Tax=Embleya sp. NPDC008237 TaxID=3363978 RepID=UPI0036EA7BA1
MTAEAPEETVGQPVTDRAPRTPGRRRGRRGRRIAAAIVLATGTGAAGAAVLALGGSGTGGSETTGTLPPNTATVSRQTLQDTREENGELGYGPTRTLINRLPGTFTRLPEAGAAIERGEALYDVDAKPVTLMYGSTPAYRELRPGVEGVDVREFEENLKALGYRGFTVDDAYTEATATAVRDWQEDLGLTETGRVELGRVVMAPAALRVDAVQAEVGAPAQPGGKVATHTGTTRAVTVELGAAERRLAVRDAPVTITLPDDSSVAGTIREVSTVLRPGEGQGAEPRTVIEVVVRFADDKAPAAVEAYTSAAVSVTLTAATRPDVLTVPVAALVALAEGGFGVEVVEGTTSRFVPVHTGLFAAGRVEVTGDGIAAGTTVGMPK